MPAEAGPGLKDWALAALLRLGGDRVMVDIEDIALEAYRLAPDRFRWRLHDYPNLELTRVVLSDVNKGPTPLVVRDESRRRRMLTIEGAVRAAEVVRAIEEGSDIGDAVGRDDALRRQDNAEIARMESHPAYLRWRVAGIDALDAVDIADLVRCPAATPEDVFAARLRERQVAAAYWNRVDLARFLGEAASRLPDILAEETR